MEVPIIIPQEEVEVLNQIISYKGKLYQQVTDKVQKGDIIFFYKDEFKIYKVFNIRETFCWNEVIDEIMVFHPIGIVTHLTDEGITYTITKEENK